MLIKTLDRYIVREHIPPFLGSMAVLTFIMILDYLIRLADLVVKKGVAFGVVVKMLTYVLAYILSMTVPMSMLVASLVAFGRMSQDFEILAAKSLGISLKRMMTAPIVTAVFVSLFLAWFNAVPMPEANHRFRNILFEIGKLKPVAQIEARSFTQIENFLIYVGKKNERTGEIFDVKINQPLPNGNLRLIFAKYGRMLAQGDTVIMQLFDGEIHESEGTGAELYRQVKFKTHVVKIPIERNIEEGKRKYRQHREKTVPMLWNEIKKMEESIERVQDTIQFKWKRRMINVLELELNKRFAMALASIVFLMLGAPLAVMTRRGGYGVAFGISFMTFTGYYIVMIGSEELARKGMMDGILAAWMPVIITLILAIFLIRKEERI
ncbi:MAG: hypothetical protein DRQ10_02195 [Candidatus Hydrothermota bacterium]|nr:MAG: hypothetical protein DRQ10_02195 [Candidatus Hydrothermae bacterium]